eukprot:CAMPEP_0174374698 /NCGR_PEP_ID=MMETSP0811_2-20130205/111843_1 /TAXON_ID=73025 ORGANISM="Eutreptiella gymnastica-like, Strain CCMP1594" /NCGR_SAMPLE_ID=MMETSP0811_2 /ASSEMBLY_ACC=CAM_ASM_000667 /LENGTH=73 /DNA_ID=CAMNT_0015524233 /DNA_START=420 /DNA_END=638 /DNA_ORIENTATION=-
MGSTSLKLCFGSLSPPDSVILAGATEPRLFGNRGEWAFKTTNPASDHEEWVCIPACKATFTISTDMLVGAFQG